MAGNCFAMAAVMAHHNDFLTAYTNGTLILSEKSPWRIVHGTPVGTSGPVKGIRYWHAWAELTAPGMTSIVFDYSNDRQRRVDRDTYYEIGQLDETCVWRFTLAEARRLLKQTGHGGPWVDGWRTMTDEPDGYNDEKGVARV